MRSKWALLAKLGCWLNPSPPLLQINRNSACRGVRDGRLDRLAAVSGTAVLSFWLVSLLLIVVPGADWAFTIGAGLRARSVLPAVAGLVIGYAAITAVVAAGVGALVAGSPAALTGLTLVGGVYLIWHGWQTARHPSPPAPELSPAGSVPAGPAPAGSAAAGPAPEGAAPAGTDRAVLVRGIGVSGLNPKGLLIFLALLPQFTDPHRSWPVAGQIVLLGLTFMATCAVFYSGLGLFARSVLQARPSVGRSVSRLSGLAMILIGLLLIVERLAR
jgi:threonine/homoserine/homoserine lactone efflux protein